MNATCGCCAGTEIAVPVSEVNAPGLSALAYRTGTYATFFETMLARLTGIPDLRTRDLADPSIALLDAWAIVADVLTFYQERIANEGYLPTARERRSVLELARLIGYRLRPGVAASVRLAFTVMPGFQGTIPAGTRAQSIPNTGQNPQFFETSGPLDARDVWNALAPRIDRAQTITETPAGGDFPPATSAEIIDTVYLDGLTTGVRPGDALLFVFGTDSNRVYVRFAESVDAQAPQQRTEVTLAFDKRFVGMALQLFIDKALYLFPGSPIAESVAAILLTVRTNAERSPESMTKPLLLGALAQIAAQQAIAGARGFTRVSAFLRQLVNAISAMIAAGISLSASKNGAALIPWPADTATSPLARLYSIVAPLSKPPSLQPANALRLGRSVAQSYDPASDIAPRLLATLKPAAAGALYQAWSGVATPVTQVQVLAARVQAMLFAAAFPGPATVAQGAPPSFGATSIASTWKSLGAISAPLAALALDAPYEKIVVGSWVVVDRPALDANGGAVPGVRLTTFHVVTGARSTVMDTGAGFSAKVTVLNVDPPWISDNAAAALSSEDALRGTVVYAQAEPLSVAAEPVDTDVANDRIDLAGIYDGLEPGRWIIVSGTRTDIPGVAGVSASELAMIAAVSQGSDTPLCAPFPLPAPPFETVHYVTAADANGDRLVVGQLTPAALAQFDLAGRDNSFAEAQPAIPMPIVPDQRYCNQVELAVGTYANAYVPSAFERRGIHVSFEGMLVDPDTSAPFPDATIDPTRFAAGLFAWRVSDDKVHTILTLANALSYAYDRSSVTIYGNVVDATHGQSTGEVLGNGDATVPFATFALGQSPLTYVSAPTPSGTASTLSVRVNELLWHELDDLGPAGPAQHAYVTRENDAQKTAVTFGNGVHGARLPTGTANVKATYRYGLGKAGNLDAGQISQLATHPLGAQAVVNPLPSTGGADADSIEQARANAPIAVMALDRLVSVRDYADFARAYAGIGKAVAARLSDGRTQLVHVTIAGAQDIPIDPTSDLYRNLVTSLQTYGDPYQPIAVDVRRVRLIVMSAVVTLLPDYLWESVAPKIRDALLALFAFDARALGQTAFLSEAVGAAQAVEGVAYLNVTKFDGVAEDITAAKLAALGSGLALRSYVQAEGARIDASVAPGLPGRILAAEVVFMTPDIPDTLILSEAGS
ncbi:MAG TPA: putative baseplate assembly protein [Candidatus Elarobacter sp.]